VKLSLKARLLLRFPVGVIATAAMLFIPAGSLHYWQAWLFIASVFPVAIVSSIYLYKRDPQLIERRLQKKEPIKEQRILVRVLKPLFAAVLLIPGLDYRFGWSRRFFGGVPVWLTIVALVMVVGGYLLAVWVMRVNSFASRTIRVEARQTVVTTGPYGLVRHPMYLGSVVICLFVPLALGSYVAWPPSALLIAFYVLRLLNEEKLLRRELPGYPEYCLRTRFRLVPFVW
jgi:protein-S-isoprenylcysteine O-methyltransferase Ste14